MKTRKKLVVLTGAGISAESGLNTFRDGNGLWENHRVEEVATPRAWQRNPELVLRFYNERRRNVLQAQPNKAHQVLAALETEFDVSIVTQNIDDLHERAGSTQVLHLHGEILKMRSERDSETLYPTTGDIKYGDKAPDGYQLRPHVVWFEEPVPMIEAAIEIMKQADIFLLIGSSLVVYPAAGLLAYVSPHVPKFVIDKHIPEMPHYKNIIPIEKSATEGTDDFLAHLKTWA
jgi:NAD-dependent deacetylase